MSDSKFDIYEMVNTQIIDLLEAGTVPWHKPWSGGDSPKNLISKKPYRGLNIMLLGSRPFASPYWLTFNQAKKIKGAVNKGEKSTVVIFWKFLEVIDDKTGKPKTIPMLRYYRVFNVEQCTIPEGKIPESVIVENEIESIDMCEEIVNAYDGPEIEYKAQQAFYSPTPDIINMPRKETFESSEEFYSVLFHEMVHSTGHVSRLDRIKDHAAFRSAEYSKEELVAEYGAAYLCAITGIENSTIDNSASYIQNWLTALKNDKRLLVTACGAAQRAIDYITNEKKEF